LLNLDNFINDICDQIGIKERNSKKLYDFLMGICGNSDIGSTIQRFNSDLVKSITVKKFDNSNQKFLVSCMNLSGSDFYSLNVYDELTKLPNITYLRINNHSWRKKYEDDGCVIVIDITDMNNFNKEYGYKEGDNLIVFCSNVIQNVFNDGLIVRLSGDCFGILTKRENVEEYITLVDERMYHSFNAHIRAGIYNLEKDDDIVLAADYANMACRSIKNRYDILYTLFDSKMLEEFNNKQYIVKNFERALNENWIKVYYQPVVRSDNGELYHYEALCRWIDPERGFIPPNIFIPILEDSHLITKLDLYMTEEICKQMQTRQEHNMPLVDVSVNFSWYDFEKGELQGQIDEILKKYDVARNKLIVEITERAMSKSNGFMNEQIDILHNLGYEVWMDDFGSEYSSLNMLKDFDFDVIKFDMKFMSDVETSIKTQKLVTSLIHLFKEFGCHTLMEGVETEWQFNFLKEVGCDFIQGYYIHRPASLDDLIKEYEGSLSNCGDPQSDNNI